MNEAPGASSPLPVLVLDPGLKDGRSHHHVINRNLALRAAEGGRVLGVVANRRAQAVDFPYRVAPVFVRGIYEDTAALGDADFATLVADHTRDIVRCLEAAGPTSLVVHTATAAFLQALAAALGTAGSQVRAAVIQLMFHPLSLAKELVDGRASNARYAAALERLRAAAVQQGIQLDLSTSCLEFSEVFTSIGATPVGVHPYALLSRSDRDAWIRRDDSISEPAPGRRRRAFLYGGDLKLDKGLPWIAAGIPRLLKTRPDDECVVHLGDNRFADARLEVLRQQILHLATVHPNLNVIVGHVPPATWDQMIASADLLLIPYDPAAYRWKTSGLFWESLLKRRGDATIAVTKDTWMEREASRSGIEVAVVPYGDTDALLAVLEQPLGNRAHDSRALAAFGEGNDDYILSRCG